MSDILEADDAFSDDNVDEFANDQIGMTSKEASDSVDAGSDVTVKKKKPKFTVFDAMLLASLLCVTLATLVLFLELNKFGSILDGDFPWRVSEFRK